MDTPNLLTSLSKTNLFKFSFMKRIVGGWNSLPFDFREALYVEDFNFLQFELFEFLYIHFLFCVCVYIFISRSIGRLEFPP